MLTERDNLTGSEWAFNEALTQRQLAQLNAELERQIAERQQTEHALRESEAKYREQAHQLEQTIQELHQAQAQFLQSEKMSSLGQMVAGIAHEINNPVSFIHGNLSHAAQYIGDLLELVQRVQDHSAHLSPEIQEFMEEIDLDFMMEDLPKLLSSMRVGTDRIRQIVLSLRNFSRLDEADMKPVNLHEGLDSTLMILQNRLKAYPGFPGVTIVKEYGDLPPVSCYAGQLNQVFMNILVNAIDALEEAWINQTHKEAGQGNRGTEERSLSASSMSQIPKSSPTITINTAVVDNNALIRIRDNGTGMPEMVRQKLFDPFFTTKPIGKGTGLGLSISYQIVVQKHRGQLDCVSQTDQGTEFTIIIPLQPQY